MGGGGGASAIRAQGEARAPNRWLNRYKDNTQAVSFLPRPGEEGTRRDEWRVITTARCLASAGHSRSPPTQATSTDNRKHP